MSRARCVLALLAVFTAGCGDDFTATPGDGAPRVDVGPGGDAAAGDAAPGDAAGGDAVAHDAAAPGCLDGGASSRCVNPTTVERCEGAAPVQVDCAASGALCGPDPADPTGSFACIAEGQPCGQIDNAGTCAGTVLAYCGSVSSTLRVVDCAQVYGICGYVAAEPGYDCTSTCELAGVTAEGSCDGTTGLTWCEFADGAYQVAHETCAAGTSCQDVDETGWPACVPDGSCAAAGPQGGCSGDILTRCVGGAAHTTDCAASGQECGYGGDVSGYGCMPPGVSGALVLSGTVTYEDRVAGPDGLGPAVPAPVRGAAVAVVADAGGAVLAAALTADDGTYVLRYDAAAGAAVHLLAATTSALPTRPVRVIRPDGQVHGFGSPSFAAAPATTLDLLVTDASGAAPAFNIFDDLITGIDYVRETLGVAAPAPVFANYVRGASDGTYYWSDGKGIFLLGGPADDDGYDDAVVLHEFGHYIEDAYGRSDSPGGDHDGSPAVPTLAWSEGFATYVSSVVRGDPVYIDTDATGATVYDLESSVTQADPTKPMTQQVSEDLVSEILWDSGDAPVPDDDGIAGTHLAVLLVETQYFRGGTFHSRGYPGVDLVDWLDGWFVRGGLLTCAAMRAIVTDLRKFPYDYAGPGGSCP